VRSSVEKIGSLMAYTLPVNQIKYFVGKLKDVKSLKNIFLKENR
jgi:hypothetical protein